MGLRFGPDGRGGFARLGGGVDFAVRTTSGGGGNGKPTREHLQRAKRASEC